MINKFRNVAKTELEKNHAIYTYVHRDDEFTDMCFVNMLHTSLAFASREPEEGYHKQQYVSLLNYRVKKLKLELGDMLVADPVSYTGMENKVNQFFATIEELFATIEKLCIEYKSFKNPEESAKGEAITKQMRSQLAATKVALLDAINVRKTGQIIPSFSQPQTFSFLTDTAADSQPQTILTGTAANPIKINAVSGLFYMRGQAAEKYVSRQGADIKMEGRKKTISGSFSCEKDVRLKFPPKTKLDKKPWGYFFS